jgi:hypothetical protein
MRWCEFVCFQCRRCSNLGYTNKIKLCAGNILCLVIWTCSKETMQLQNNKGECGTKRAYKIQFNWSKTEARSLWNKSSINAIEILSSAGLGAKSLNHSTGLSLSRVNWESLTHTIALQKLHKRSDMNRSKLVLWRKRWRRTHAINSTQNDPGKKLFSRERRRSLFS